MTKKLLLTLVVTCLLLQLVACVKPSRKVVTTDMELLPVDSTLDGIPSNGYAESLQPYADALSATMDEVIGHAPKGLRAYQPESPLSNWTADVLREAATAYIGSPADIGIVNMGGLRCEIPAGDITLRKIYELMPFDNQLTIVWLKGADINDLCQSFAAYGGQGVSGLTFCMKEQRAHNICINGQPIKPESLYSVATNDYLVAGNDGMDALTHHQKRLDTGVTIRDIYIAAVKKNTAEGKPIMAELEGRLGFCDE